MKKMMMLATILVSGVMAQAQETEISRDQPYVQFGLKGGVNLADVKSEIYTNTKVRKSFYAGFLAHIHMSPHLALQPEVVYSRQGFEQNISSGLDLTGKFDYINMPVMLQYMNRGVRLETGPQVGFLVNAQADYTDGRDSDVENKLKSTDFSWGFGAGYLFPQGIGLSARYNLGISNINKDITRSGVTDTEINNRVWQFGVFYQFAR